MDRTILSDVAICIVAAWLLAVGAQLLRQPLILAYLAAGFVVGPMGLGMVRDHASIEMISGLGLLLLLFMIGLEIDLKKILGAGRLITATAAIQILGSFCAGWLVFWKCGGWWNGGRWDALYLGVAAALSSTVIVVKILYEQRELDTIAGRLTLGILVLQDLFAILFLAIQPNLRDTGVEVVLLSFGRVLVLVAVAFCASRYLLPALFKSVARLPELVLVGALAWCFLMAGLAGLLELSREMGALVAGVAISTFPYTLDISAKVASLRDFFVTLFFVSLGMAVPKPSWALLAWATAFASLLVATRIATVFPLLYGMRQGHRASLLTSFQLAQVSELGLVIMALGASAGQVSEFAVGVVSYAFVILAVVSGYVLVRKHSIVLACSGWLKRAGLKDLDQSEPAADLDSRPAKLFLLGFSWTASSLLEEISRNEPSWIKEMTVLDFNPHVNQELKARKIRVIYGDVSQRETLLHAEVNRAKVIVSTLPNSVLKGTNNVRLARELRELNPEAKIIMHAELLSDVPRLYAAGADFVCVPRIIEAEELRKVIEAAMEDLLEEKRLAMDQLIAERDEVIP